MANEPIHIEEGPDRWDLLTSLGEGNASPRKTVRFKVANGHTGTSPFEIIEVAITGLDQEDGSGHSWLFRGYRKGRDPNRGKIHGLYSTANRTGWYARGDAQSKK